MPVIPIRFKFDPGPMIGLIRGVRNNLAKQGSPLLKSAYAGVADQYMSGMRQRFLKLSHGGGSGSSQDKPSSNLRTRLSASTFSTPGTTDYWAPLRPSTIRRKRGDTRILQHKGSLLRSLFRGGAGNVFQVDGKGARVGTSIYYSIFHQNGTRFMPAREILVPPDEQLADAMQKKLAMAVQAGIDDALKSITQKPRTAA